MVYGKTKLITFKWKADFFLPSRIHYTQKMHKYFIFIAEKDDISILVEDCWYVFSF